MSSITAINGEIMKYNFNNSVSANVSVPIDTNHFLNIYHDPVAEAINAQVFAVDTATYQIYSPNVLLLVDGMLTSAYTYKNICVTQIDSNHFVTFYQGADYDGFAQVLTVDTTTWLITTSSVALEFAINNMLTPSVCTIDSNHFIVFSNQTLNQTNYQDILEINTTTWEITSLVKQSTTEDSTIYQNSIQIDSNHFVLFHQGSPYVGKCKVYTVNTSTWAITSSAYLEFEATLYNFGVCCGIDSNHILNLWQGVDSDGFGQVFEINTSTWAITTAGAVKEWDTAKAGYIDVKQMDANHFVITYSGSSDDGYTKILEVNTSTWAITTKAALEFDTVEATYCQCEIVDSNHFLTFYSDGNSDGQVISFSINTSTWAISTIASAWGLAYGFVKGFYNTSAQLDANHFVNFWSGESDDGFVQVFTVDTTTFAVITAGDYFKFNDYGAYHSCCAIDSNHFLDIYAGTGNDGYAQVFTVDTTTFAVTTSSAALEFDTQNGIYNSCVAIDSNHFINFYAGLDNDGYVQVLTVNTSTWAVTTASASLEFDTTNGLHNKCFKVDTNHFINIWSGVDGDGMAQIFEVNTTTWAVSTAASVLEFDTASCTFPTISQVDTNHFVIIWAGSGADGYIQVITVDTTGWEITTSVARLEFDTVNGENNCIVQVDSNHYINFWQGVDDDGFAQIFTVNTTTFGVTTACDSLEFDTQGTTTANRADNSCNYIDATHIINFGARAGNIGYAQVFRTTINNEFSKSLSDYCKFIGSIKRDITTTKISPVKIVPTLSYTRTLHQTYTQVINVISESVNSAGKIFREVINSIPTYSRVLTSLRTFGEVIKSIGNAVFLAPKVFTESAVIADTLSTIGTFKKVLTDIVSATGSKILSTGRSLIDSIIPADTLSKLGTFFKQITESVNAIATYTRRLVSFKVFTNAIKIATWRPLVALGRTFKDIMEVATWKPLTSLGRQFVQTIISVDTAQLIRLSILRTFTEALNLISNLGNSTGRIFRDSFKSISSVLARAGKMLTQEIKITDVYSRLLTSFKTLTEVIVAVGVMGGNVMTRVLSETVNVIWSLGQQTARIITEAISVIGSLVILPVKVLQEVINAVDSISKYLTKIFTEIVNITDYIGKLVPAKIFEETISAVGAWIVDWAKELTETISVVDDFFRDLAKTLTDSVSVIGVIAKAVPAQIYSEVINITDTFAGIGTKVLEEIFTVSDEVLKDIITIFKDTVNVIDKTLKTLPGLILTEVTNIYGSAIAIVGNWFEETITVVSDAVKSMPLIFSEITNVSDTFLKPIFKLLSETINVLSQLINLPVKIFKETIATGGLKFGEMATFLIGRTITAKVYLRQVITNSFARILEQVVTASDNGSTFARVLELFETVLADSVNTIIATKLLIERVIIKYFIEKIRTPIVLTDRFMPRGRFYPVSGKIKFEVLNISSNFLGEMGQVLRETINVIGSAIKYMPIVLTDVVNVVHETFSDIVRVFTEIIQTVSSFARTAQIKLLCEIVRIAHIPKSIIFTRLFGEIINVFDILQKQFPGYMFEERTILRHPLVRPIAHKLFIEPIITHLAHLRLIMDGIEVGLWKKIQRVTSGVWRKIDRFDN